MYPRERYLGFGLRAISNKEIYKYLLILFVVDLSKIAPLFGASVKAFEPRGGRRFLRPKRG